MSVTYTPLYNSNPTFFKLIPKICVCLFLGIIVPIGLIYFCDPVIFYFLNLLPYIPFLEDDLPFIKIIVPLIRIVVLAFVIWPYLRSIPYILDKIHMNPRDEMMDYIIYKGWKISYYRTILFLRPKGKNLFSASYYLDSKILDRLFSSGFQIAGLVLLLMAGFLTSFIYVSYVGKDFIGFNVLESQTLENYINTNWPTFEFRMAIIFNSFVALVTTFFFIMIYLTTIELIPIIFIQYLFSAKKGFVDTSDIPISFINMAIQELKSVDFLESFYQIQSKKNKISNFINDSLESVKVDKGNSSIDYMNFCFQKSCGLLNKEAREDIRFRLNSLYEKMNETLIKVNHMKCLEDKNKIMQDLEMYLQVIENKDLSEIDPKEYVIKESAIDQVFHFFFHKMLIPLILFIIAQKFI